MTLGWLLIPLTRVTTIRQLSLCWHSPEELAGCCRQGGSPSACPAGPQALRHAPRGETLSLHGTERGDTRLAEKGPAGVGEEKGHFVNCRSLYHEVCSPDKSSPCSALLVTQRLPSLLINLYRRFCPGPSCVYWENLHWRIF